MFVFEWFEEDDVWGIVEFELMVDEDELVGEFIGFIVVNADLGLWLNGMTKRNLPMPSDFDTLSYSVSSSSSIVEVDCWNGGTWNLSGRSIVIGIS